MRGLCVVIAEIYMRRLCLVVAEKYMPPLCHYVLNLMRMLKIINVCNVWKLNSNAICFEIA